MNTNMTGIHTLFHVEYACYNYAKAATGLASTEVHIGRLPRPSLAVFDRSYGGDHQRFDCDHLAYCDLVQERQQRAYELVHGQHALTFARVNGRNFTPSDALLRDILILGIWINLPSALHPTVSTAACQERFNDWVGRGYDDFVPGKSPKQPLPGMRLHDSLHDRHAYPEFIACDQWVGPICPWEGLFLCHFLPKRGQICYVLAPPPQSWNWSQRSRARDRPHQR